MPRTACARARRRAGAALAALALLVAGCSDGGDGEASESTDPTAAATGDRVEVTEEDLGPFAGLADPQDVAGPGTPLGGGLTVPDGALLQGAAFPDLVGAGFRALLLVTGDPVDVYDSLGGQASDLGMTGSGACLAGDAVVGCQARYVDGADGESLVVTVSRKVVPMVGVASGVGLVYRPPGTADEPVADTGSPPTPPIAPVELPDPVPEPLFGDIAGVVRLPDSKPRLVESGSTLVGLPGPCACDGSGWSMVVHLEGVERDVLHGYLRQFSDLGDPPDIEDRHRDDITLMGARVGQGDTVAEIRAFIPDDGRPYAIVTVREG